MLNAYFIFKKDIKSIFMSPLAYVVMAVFTCVMSFLLVAGMEEASMRGVFGLMATLFIFIMPFLTMKSFAEEFAAGTDELLVTSPLTTLQIVLGKYMAVMTLVAAVILLSGQYAIIIGIYGSPDWGPVFTGYVGLFLLCGAFASVGVFCSSLTRSQPAAAVAAFGLAILLIVVRAAQSAVDSFAAQFPGELSAKVAQAASSALEALSVLDHYFDFEKGVIDSTHIVYYIVFILLFLFFTIRRLEAKRI